MLTRELRNTRERESRERQTDETDRRVADDDVTLEYRTNESHKRSRTKTADFTSKNGRTK